MPVGDELLKRVGKVGRGTRRRVKVKYTDVKTQDSG